MSMLEELLKKPVAALGMSENFILLCSEMGFETIGDIVAITPEELIRREGFTFHWLNELISFLDKNEALHVLQARPAKENTSA